mmetsp:Transcript_12969/g.30311  ORF Transcript_12969/g.30311 Transcript_12969/m.30311 type:complete len:753 (-) Transcript_12969:7-2265(-)
MADARQPENSQALLKEQVKERFCHYQVERVEFGVLSADEIARYAEVEILNGGLYQDEHRQQALPFGPLDRKLGTSQKSFACMTCKQRIDDCIGHFGHIQLPLPVFHVGFFQHCSNVLYSICKGCGRLLLPELERRKYLSRIRRPNLDENKRKAMHKAIVESCKKIRTCPYCGLYNAPLKKGPGVPILIKHQLAGSLKGTPDDVGQNQEESFKNAVRSNEDLKPHVQKAHEDITPLKAWNLFRRMSPQDKEILDIVNPEELLLWAVPVAPACVRPTVMQGDAGANEDDLTGQAREIFSASQALRQHVERGGQARHVLEAWQFLQNQVAIYMNSEANGLDLPKGKPIRSICTRLKGKEGRFRGNLSGKRVDFSGRTVISPDPNVSVEEVVIPEAVARRMTYTETVCNANLERLRQAIVRGPEEHPGAAMVRWPSGKSTSLRQLRKNYRAEQANELRPGCIVERHMRNGDIVLFNRQPSLHRLSIMAHKVRVMPGRTFRFNECICAPYNADFDGDEMNIHFPQTEEARAEAINLMGVKHGLVTPKNGEVAVSATQDFLTASFLMTQKDVFLSRDKFCQVLASLTDGAEDVELPPPAIMKPCELWTGKQVFNVLLRPNGRCKVLVNLEVPEKNYSKKGESMCPNDGWVIFRNSELVSGNLGKKILGGAKNGLFFRLIRDISSEAAIACMSRLAKASSRWLMNRGFTIGIDDVTAHKGVKMEKARITHDKYDVVQDHIDAYNAGTIALKPGCNAEHP